MYILTKQWSRIYLIPLFCAIKVENDTYYYWYKKVQTICVSDIDETVFEKFKNYIIRPNDIEDITK